MDVNPGSGGNFNPNFPPKYPHQQRSWFSRNWIWFVPVTLMFVSAPFLCCFGGGALLYGTVGAPFKACVEQLNESAEVTARIGSPIKKSSIGFQLNNLNSDNGNGSASLGQFSVEGPKGEANVQGKMKQFGGVWSMEEITVEFDDGTSIVLPTENEAP